MAGSISASDLPTTFGALQLLNREGDAFIAKLKPKGTDLIYATYLGSSGSDSGVSIAVVAHGNAYIAGISGATNFPTLPSAYQPESTRPNTGVLPRITDPTPPRITGIVIKGKKLFGAGEGLIRAP